MKINQKLYFKFINIKSNNKLKSCSFKPFSQAISLPTIDVDKYLNKSQGWEKECKLASDCLHETGILIIKDPVC